MSRFVPPLLLTVPGLLLVCAGLHLDAWWTIAAGVSALTLAAWLVTQPE